MPIPGLTIIGEAINDSVPSTRQLFEAADYPALADLARAQDQAGAAYIDVNVGPRPAEFLADLVRRLQAVTAKPLSIDTPDPVMAEAALKAYDLKLAAGRAPILNSISPLRLQMLDLRKIVPFRPILLVSERLEAGHGQANTTDEQVYQTAQAMVAEAANAGIPIDQCLLDPAISPIATDSEGHLARVIGAMRRIHADPTLAGVHMSVGLSNFTVMLPPKRKDGSPTRNPLENALLTLTAPLGLDHVIGSVKRNYEMLPAGDPAMACVNDCLKLAGFESIMRVQEFYST